MARKRLKDLTITKVALVPAGANPGAHVVLYKSAPVEDPDPTKKEEPVKKALKDMTHEELLAHAEELEKAAPAAAEPEPEIPAAVQKMLDDQAQAIKKANDRAEAAEAAAKVEKEARERTSMASVAKAKIPHLPGTDTERGNVLYDMEKSLSKESYEAALKLLEAGNAAVAKAMEATGFDEDGTEGDSAVEKLDAIAKQLVKDGKAKTYEQAFDQAAQENGELYTQYRAEKRESRERRAH